MLIQRYFCCKHERCFDLANLVAMSLIDWEKHALEPMVLTRGSWYIDAELMCLIANMWETGSSPTAILKTIQKQWAQVR